MRIGCVICCDQFREQSDENVVLKNCGHVFHNVCLKTWLKRSKTCPTCRQPTLDDPSYVGRVHFHCFHQDNNFRTTLMDLVVELKIKLMKKEDELKKAETHNKELEGRIKVVHEHFKILFPDICVNVPLNSDGDIQPRRSIVQTPSISAARPSITSSRTVNQVATRGQVTSSALNTPRRT